MSLSVNTYARYCVLVVGVYNLDFGCKQTQGNTKGRPRGRSLRHLSVFDKFNRDKCMLILGHLGFDYKII